VCASITFISEDIIILLLLSRTVYKEKKLLVYWEKNTKKPVEIDLDNAKAATGYASWWRWCEGAAAGSDDGMHAFVGVCGDCSI